jgi:glycerol dehydrogenase-like iron-containing ADH family enzyme
MLRPPQRIRQCLAQAQGATTAQDLGFSQDMLLECLLHAHEFRSRFTILDLAMLAGVLPNQAGEIVEQWG